MSAGRRCLLGIAALFLLASGARAQFVATVISSNLYEPNGVATGADGNVYITDSSNNRLLQFKPSSGELTLFAGVSNRFSPGTNNGVGPFAKFNHPTGIVATAGGLIVVDQGNQELRFVSYAGGVTNFAGIAGVTGTNNGPGATATFNYPTGIAADGLGNYYVADQNNNLIRKIDSNTNVTTIAATNVATGKIYQFSTPTGVAVDNNGNIWVSDTGNNVISMISNQTVTVVAGTFGMSGFHHGDRRVVRRTFRHSLGRLHREPAYLRHRQQCHSQPSLHQLVRNDRLRGGDRRRHAWSAGLGGWAARDRRIHVAGGFGSGHL